MRIALTVLLVLVSAQAGLGQLADTLSGGIGPGEYHVTDTIYIVFGDTLRIYPPATLIFDGPYPFYIYGKLLAEGSESDSIVFTTDTLVNPDRWRGLRFYQPGSSGSDLQYCLIEYARQLNDRGGGIYCDNSSPSFSNCRISENLAISPDGGGGGIYCHKSGPHFTNCHIIGNSTTGGWPTEGGGVRCAAQSSPTFTNCTISANSSEHGGGGISCAYSSPIFAHCTIGSNSALGPGGGINCLTASAPIFTNCVISDNLADGNGGGVNCDNWPATATFTNCVISGNQALLGGGGVFFGYSAAGASFTNCTIVDNAAMWSSGGGVHCRFSSPTFEATIIAFSTSGTGIHFDDSPDCTIKYCDVFGNSHGDIAFEDDDPSHGPPGIGELVTTNVNADSCDAFHNIYIDPMFVNLGAGDFHLDNYSPCISAAEADGPDEDIEGNPRPNPPRSLPDIGAYENEHCGPPSAFNLISPQWNDTCWTLEAVLVWQTALDPDDTVSYEVWRDTLSDLSTASELVSGHPDTVFPLVGLSDDHAYYWTVHASDVKTAGTWSEDTLVFHTYYPEPPDSFFLATPVNGDTVDTATPILHWFKASDPDPGDTICYRLVWSYDTEFGVCESTMVCDTSFTFLEDLLFSRSVAKGSPIRALRHKSVGVKGLNAVEDDSTIYWKVQAIDRFGLATLCQPGEGWSFHIYVEQPPNSFDLLSPADGETLDTSAVTFVWQASHDPDPEDSVVLYRVYLAFDSAFTAGLDSLDVSITELVFDSLEDDRTYWWRAKAFDTHGNETFSNQTWSLNTNFNAVISAEDVSLPTEFNLCQNYPNPFNPTTMIKYQLPKDCQVKLAIYNILGRKVAALVDEEQVAGYKTASWDASSFSGGIYFYRLKAGDFVQTRKMVLLK